MTDIQKYGNTNANPVVALIRGDKMQAMVHERLGKRAGQFTTSLISLVNTSPKIAECTPITVIQAALTAASMDLPINQNLGFAYIVPYKNKGVMEAQFQIGWKSFVQLAQRSGYFKTINVTDVREGELAKIDRLTGVMEFEWAEDEEEREKLPIIGYAAHFELLNGFSKTLYMTKKQATKHGEKYSKSYGSDYGLWKNDFDVMALKTVIKQLLSKFAPLSTEMQEAVTYDQAVVRENGQADYIDGTSEVENELADDSEANAIIEANIEASLKK